MPRSPLGAGRAILALLLVTGSQIFVGIVFGVLLAMGGLVAGLRPHQLSAALARSSGILLLVVGVFSAAATIGALRWLAWSEFLDKSPAGLGAWLPRLRRLWVWGCLGAGSGLAYLAVARYGRMPNSKVPPSLVVQAAASGGFSRVAWMVVALALAPVFEELLFRGILWRGLSRSWGPAWGAVGVTGLFVLLHLPETFRYWPATVFIAVMASLALAARIRSGSIASSIATHFAYNLVIAASVFAR